jgi:hypothetical protein
MRPAVLMPMKTRDFPIRPEDEQDGNEKCDKPANDGQKDARTDKNSQPGHTRGSGQGNGNDGTGRFRSDVEDAFEELRLREQTDDLTIPTFLDRRAVVCAHCGKPGGKQWDYDGAAVRLHAHCEQPWIANYKASHRRPTTTTAGSSL